MASAKQVAANRRNASLQRGPLSAEASAALSPNAVAHGLTAKHVVLRHEDYVHYSELRAGIVMEYRPHTPQEHRIADQIAQNYWRLLRCRRVETATFENRLGTLKNRFDIDPNQSFNDDAGISVCMANDSRDFDVLRRYETSIERAWYRAIRELRAAQRERRKYNAAQAEEDAYNPPLEDTIATRHPWSPLANQVNNTNKPSPETPNAQGGADPGSARHALVTPPQTTGQAQASCATTQLSENRIDSVSQNDSTPPLEDTIASRQTK